MCLGVAAVRSGPTELSPATSEHDSGALSAEVSVGGPAAEVQTHVTSCSSGLPMGSTRVVSQPATAGVCWFQSAAGRRVHLTFSLAKGLATTPLCQEMPFKGPDRTRGIGWPLAEQSGELCANCVEQYQSGRRQERDNFSE